MKVNRKLTRTQLEIATDTVANTTNIFSLATENSGLVVTLATRWRPDFSLIYILIKRVELKQTFHLILLCFCYKKCAKSHKQSQFNFEPCACLLSTIIEELSPISHYYSYSIAYPETTANIMQQHLWFPPKMMSEERAQKLHTDDLSLPSSG